MSMQIVCLPCCVPFFAAEPPNKVLVPKAANPINLVDIEGGPEGDMWGLCGIRCPVTGIRVSFKVAFQSLVSYFWMMGDVEHVKVAEEGDTPLGRHTTPPRGPVLLPMFWMAF